MAAKPHLRFSMSENSISIGAGHKLFCELRPGLLLWIVIDLACIHHQYHQYGVVTDSILLVSALQAIYVIDCSFYEEGSLTMLDITTDGLVSCSVSATDLVAMKRIHFRLGSCPSSKPCPFGLVESVANSCLEWFWFLRL